MSENSLYIISFTGLGLGEHEFKYNINNTFFQEFEFSEVQQGNIDVVVKVNKQSTMLIVTIDLNGFVVEVCDRCGEDFNMVFESSRQLIVRLGGTELVEEDDIIYLPAAEHEIDLKQHIYESIILGLPLKRIHPDDAKGKSTCDPEVLKKLKELSVGEENEGIDPRWAALKNIKIN
jgi:uncharacterized protein